MFHSVDTPPDLARRYIGRFAPSPTGPLHFGSLIGALASFLDARAHGGQWLLRIEDIDPPREAPGAAGAIRDCLRRHGLEPDGPVLHQSRRHAIYRQAAQRLVDAGQAFYCTCSRAVLTRTGGIHPDDCHARRQPPPQPYAIRARMADRTISFEDRLQGTIAQRPASAVGDFVIWRKEDLPAYQLAVVVDDAAQGVTHVVRGSDLLDNTPRQIHLQDCLQLPQPNYLHVPVIANQDGQKLSKQTFAAALDSESAADNVIAALDFLRQPRPAPRESLTKIVDWAIARWQPDRIPRRRELSGDELPPSCRIFAT